MPAKRSVRWIAVLILFWRSPYCLALGCSIRIGEILGLIWDCVDDSDESLKDGTTHVSVVKELKRYQKDSLRDFERRGHSKVIFTIP